MPLATIPDVAAFLGVAINRVLHGRTDPKTGNCLAVLCGQLIRAIEGGALTHEIEAMEKELRRLKDGVAGVEYTCDP
jgi:hypothetical protein